jgi:tRNA-binding EMAP/Myf-like protein
MSTREAAYLATITKVEPIEGKDKIHYAYVKAGDTEWGVISSILIQPGDKIVYIEYDVIVSEGQGWAEFLRKRCYSPKYRGFKISAMRMSGKISYGLVLTIKEAGLDEAYNDFPVGTPLSAVLKIFPIDDAAEYEKQQPVQLSKFQRFLKKYFYLFWKLFFYRKPQNSQFPTNGAIKTDETRIQNLTYLFDEKYKGLPVYVTEKCIDGETLLETNKGFLKIKDIVENKLNVKVKAFNEIDNKNIFTKITDYFKSESNQNWYEIMLETGEILKITENHPIYLPELNCYRETKFLKKGDFLLKN